MKKTMETILGILIALIIGAGGGFVGGVAKSKKMQNNELNTKIDLQHKELIEANIKLDSLKSLPAKVDTVYKVTKEILTKTDTLIITNKKILDNTEEIKADVKTLKKVICDQ